MLTVVESYRVMLVSRARALLEWIVRACLHPASICSFRDIQEWFLVWKCYFANLLSFNTAEKNEKLLDWVRSRVGPKLEASDFGPSWRSGVLLCALVESIAPGSCPRYDLLNVENRLANAQLAIQLIEKVNLRPCLTAQELSSDDADIEKPLKALLAQFRMAAAKRKLRNAVKSPGDERPGSGQSSDLFAKGMGLIFAVKGRKASFNIFRRGQGAFSFVIEIQGPDGTLGSALITHKSPARSPGSPDSNSGSSSASTGSSPCPPPAPRLKRQLSAESKKIVIDYTISNEMISVSYTPVTSGKHTLNIVAQGQHILKSPYSIAVDCNTTEVTAKVVETLFRPKRSALQRLGRRFSGTSLMASSRVPESSVAVPLPAQGDVMGKVVARRVIKRTIIGVNGASDIVIHGDDEQALVRALKSISNLNPKNREKFQNRRFAAPPTFVLRPVTELRNLHTARVRTDLDRSVSEVSERSSADEAGSPVTARSAPSFQSPLADRMLSNESASAALSSPPNTATDRAEPRAALFEQSVGVDGSKGCPTSEGLDAEDDRSHDGNNNSSNNPNNNSNNHNNNSSNNPNNNNNNNNSNQARSDSNNNGKISGDCNDDDVDRKGITTHSRWSSHANDVTPTCVGHLKPRQKSLELLLDDADVDDINANFGQSWTSLAQDEMRNADDRRLPTITQEGDENNNPTLNVVHNHEFLIRRSDVTLNIINENPYVPKIGAVGDLALKSSAVADNHDDDDDVVIELNTAKPSTLTSTEGSVTSTSATEVSTTGSTESCMPSLTSMEQQQQQRSASERRLLYQMESKSMRLKSEWRLPPETIPEREDPVSTEFGRMTVIDEDVVSPALGESSSYTARRPSLPSYDDRYLAVNSAHQCLQKTRTDSREGHVGSETDEIEDRMQEIDGDIRQLPVSSVLDKFTHFSPAPSPECSTSGSSSNCSDLAPPVRGSPSIFGMAPMPPAGGYHHLHGY